jgi:predicted O-methyltransferase YrrM
MLNSVHYLKYRLGLAEAVTQTTKAEQQALRELAAGRKHLVEIGVFHGVNTRNFREVMHSEGTLLAVDPYFRTFFGIRGYGWARRIAHREAAKCRRGALRWIEKLGRDAVRTPEAQAILPVDFIFIDGDHSYEGLKGDWEAWNPHIAQGGIAALHDSRGRTGAGSEIYTNEVILHDSRFEVVAGLDLLLCFRRK